MGNRGSECGAWRLATHRIRASLLANMAADPQSDCTPSHVGGCQALQVSKAARHEPRQDEGTSWMTSASQQAAVLVAASCERTSASTRSRPGWLRACKIEQREEQIWEAQRERVRRKERQRVRGRSRLPQIEDVRKEIRETEHEADEGPGRRGAVSAEKFQHTHAL